MGKVRSESDMEKPKKRKEKKVSEDKVRKSEKKDKKDRKLRKAAVQEIAPAEDVEELSRDGNSDDADDMDLDDEIALAEKKAARRQRKKEARAHDEVLKRLMEKELGPSPTTSGLHVVAEKEKQALRKQEKRAAREAKKAEAAPPTANGASGPLFVIDTKPQQVDLSALKPPPPAEEGQERAAPAMNRQARRRLVLIDRQKDKIIKQLKKDGELAEGSDEFNAEVESRVASWTADTDEKAEVRNAKKKVRKEKEAKRLKNKYGKALTGRRLKEREKEIKLQEKQKRRDERRGGISTAAS